MLLGSTQRGCRVRSRFVRAVFVHKKGSKWISQHKTNQDSHRHAIVRPFLQSDSAWTLASSLVVIRRGDGLTVRIPVVDSTGAAAEGAAAVPFYETTGRNVAVLAVKVRDLVHRYPKKGTFPLLLLFVLRLTVLSELSAGIGICGGS